MVEEVTIEVDDLYAEMFEEVREQADERQVRALFENFIHSNYQQVQQSQDQFIVTAPEDRETNEE